MMPPPDIELDTITSTDMLDEFYGAFAPACFALPGLMGVLSLVDPQDAAFWRASCSPRSSS
jgi:hypothetical protein